MQEEARISLRDAAALLGVNPHTLRYYERIGLLTNVPRSSQTHREYTARELEVLRFVRMLRDTGMHIRQIRVYAELRQQGEATRPERRALLVEHRQDVLEQIARLHEGLHILEQKIDRFAREQLSTD